MYCCDPQDVWDRLEASPPEVSSACWAAVFSRQIKTPHPRQVKLPPPRKRPKQANGPAVSRAQAADEAARAAGIPLRRSARGAARTAVAAVTARARESEESGDEEGGEESEQEEEGSDDTLSNQSD